MKIRNLIGIDANGLNTAMFFMGGDQSGAQLHWHIAAFNLLYIGQKDWLLIPPRYAAVSKIPSWELFHMQGLRLEHIYRCTQQAGDLILLPDAGGHATLCHGFSAGLGVLYGWRDPRARQMKTAQSGLKKAQEAPDASQTAPRDPPGGHPGRSNSLIFMVAE